MSRSANGLPPDPDPFYSFIHHHIKEIIFLLIAGHALYKVALYLLQDLR